MKTLSIKAVAVALFMLPGTMLSAQNNLENIPATITKLEIKNMVRAELSIPSDGKKGYEILDGKGQVKVSFDGNTMKIESSGAASVPKLNIYHQFNDIEVLDISQVTLNKVKQELINITAKDNAQVNGSGDFANLTIFTRDAALVKLEGDARNLTVSSKDASNVNLDALNADVAAVTTDDVSTVRVKAKKSLVADARNLSRIIYNGEPSENIILNTKDFARIREASSEDDVNIIAGGAEDTMRVRMGGKKFIIINDVDNKLGKADSNKKKKDKKDLKNVWAGFEVGMSSFVTPELAFKQEAKYSFLDNNVGKSWFWGLNLFETDLHLVKNKVALTTGLGMNWANFRFNNTQTLIPDVDSLAAFTHPNKLSNNRLRVFSLDVPLMIKVAPRKKGPHIAVGAIFSYSPGTKLILEDKSQGYEEERVIKDDFNVNPFRATATVRVGYSWLRLFANYSLTPYFSKSAGPDVRSFQAGLTVIPF